MAGEQWWCSGESTPLPPVWPGFNSQVWCHMWVEFVVGSLPCSKRFFSGYSGFPLSSKPTFPNSNSTRNQVDEEPLCGCATSKSLFIYFYYFIFWGLHDLRVQWAMSSSAQHASFKYIQNWHWFWVFITSLVEKWFKYLMMLCPLNVSL